MLSVLIGILLISGGLQCAFDCLTSVDSLQSSFTLQTQSDRCDDCHPAIEHTAPTISCLNKACHQRLPQQRNFAVPEIFQLEKQGYPLYSSYRQPTPQYRAGSAIVIPPAKLLVGAHLPTTSSQNLSQTLFSIRSTVLLC